MSQQDGQKKTIDGDTYNVRMLPPLDANDILLDLGHILAPVFAVLGGKVIGAKENVDQDLLDELLDGTENSNVEEAVERAILKVIDRIDKRKFREIVDKLAEVTDLEGAEKSPILKSVMRVQFQGRIGTMYKWLAFALRVQFQDFFSAIQPAISRVGLHVAQAP